MGSWSSFLFAYLLGGITFLPLVVLAIVLHGLYTSPVRNDLEPPTRRHDEKNSIVQEGDDLSGLDASRKDEPKTRASRDLDVAAGYFAVCREYSPVGIDSKPIERATPTGNATVAAPSPSVYQTMYRSIFERKAAPGPLEDNSVSQRPKRAGNVFYVVLRHGHLMLFDDDSQLEVRHVISLAHHSISIYSGGDITPEGELFIKRNALCLTRRDDGPGLGPDSQVSKPFFLFCDDCSAKEDFYFSMLQNQEQTFSVTDGAPKPKGFEVKNIISLVQKLHSSEEHLHTRWLNAMIGRIFLGLYKTKDLETYICDKITKKISRVKRPSFLTNISIRSIDIGEAAPFFRNLKLKDLTVEGECVVEADVRYSGNFRIEVAATAKIDLGARFKAREVNLVLAVVVKRVEGHMLFKVKAPPSNRIWFSFQSMPKLEMAIEPIVSSRQITYTVILRQIENRIKEVFAETLVQPFWDDMPFFKTEHKRWRGGIFEGDDAVVSAMAESGVAQGDGSAEAAGRSEADIANETRPLEKSHTIPVMESQAIAPGLFGRKMAKGSHSSSASASSTSLDAKGAQPMPIKSPTFLSSTSTPEPVVGTDASHADIFKPSSSPPDHASNYMASLSSRSQQISGSGAPIISPTKARSITQSSIHSSSSSTKEDRESSEKEDSKTPIARRNTASSSESLPATGSQSPVAPSFVSQTGSVGRGFFRRENSSIPSPTASEHSQKKNTLAAVQNAATQAKQWGWNAFQKQREARKNGDALTQLDLNQPMGRGQPLPPPGTPLPGPPNGNGRSGIGGPAVPKRKPLPPDSHEEASTGIMEEKQDPETQPPPLPHRRRRGRSYDTDDTGEDGGMLVVAAPADDSQPATPADEKDEYLAPQEKESASSDECKTEGAPSLPASRNPSTTFDKSLGPKGSFSIPLGAEPVKESPKEPIDLEKIPSGGESIVAVPVHPAGDDDDDDGYAGWMDEDDFDDESDKVGVSKPLSNTPAASDVTTPASTA